MRKILTTVMAVSLLMAGCSKKAEKQGSGPSKAAASAAKAGKSGAKPASAKPKPAAAPKAQGAEGGWVKVSIPKELGGFQGVIRFQLKKSLDAPVFKAIPQLQAMLAQKVMDADARAFLKCVNLNVPTPLHVIEHVLMLTGKDGRVVMVGHLAGGLKSAKVIECLKNTAEDFKKSKKVSVGGKEAYLNDNGKDLMVVLSEDEIAMLHASSEKEVTDLGNTVVKLFPLCPKLAAGGLPKDHSVWFYSSDVSESMFANIPTLKDVKVSAAEGYVDLTDKISVKFMAKTASGQEADRVAKTLQAEIKTKLEPQLKMFQLDSVLKSLEIKPKGDVVCLKLALTGQDLQKLVGLAMNMMMGAGAPMMRPPQMPAQPQKAAPMKGGQGPMGANLPPRIKMNIKGVGKVKGLKGIRPVVMK